MIVRSLLIAGIAGGSMIVASPAAAQYVPLGPLMNAIQPSQPAPPPGMRVQQPSQGNKASRPGGAAGNRSKAGTAPRQYHRPPSTTPSYIGQQSEENG